MASRKTIHKATRKSIKVGDVTLPGTSAEHYKEGAHDFVKIGDLRVLVTKDGPWWFAQGLEIDYTAQGKSLDEVKDKFIRGLAATAHAYIMEFGSIQKLLRPAPADVLRELSNASSKGLLNISTLSEHELEAPIKRALPFSGVRYFERRESLDMVPA